MLNVRLTHYLPQFPDFQDVDWHLSDHFFSLITLAFCYCLSAAHFGWFSKWIRVWYKNVLAWLLGEDSSGFYSKIVMPA